MVAGRGAELMLVTTAINRRTWKLGSSKVAYNSLFELTLTFKT